jgi:hypothetical protein
MSGAEDEVVQYQVDAVFVVLIARAFHVAIIPFINSSSTAHQQLINSSSTAGARLRSTYR